MILIESEVTFHCIGTNLQAQCMDVWCDALCCMHIYFKTVFHSASEHALIFIQKIENFSGRPHTHQEKGKPTKGKGDRLILGLPFQNHK